MRSRFRSKSIWVVIVLLISSLVFGAWLGSLGNEPRITEADWIDAIQSAD